MHFSMCRRCAQCHTHYMSMSVRLRPSKWIKPPQLLCVCVNVRIMCVHVNACHNVGKAAYYTEGLYKNVLSAFGILLTVC